MHPLGLAAFVTIAVGVAYGCSGGSASGVAPDGGANPGNNTQGGNAGSNGDAGNAPPPFNTGAEAGSNYEPAPELITGCDTLCTALSDTQCGGSGTEQACLAVCRAAIELPSCASAYEDLFACAESSSTTCAPDGGATELTDCSAEQAATFDCVLNNATESPISGPCAAYCDGVLAAECASGPTSEIECSATCALAGSLPDCSSLWTSVLGCSEGATFACDESGNPMPQGCELLFLLYAACAGNSLGLQAP